MTIRAQTYTFHCRFTTGAVLPGYLGSTLRGALGWALKKTSCALRRQQCTDCLLREQCAYAWIFETERYRTGDGRQVNARPHPFVLQPGPAAEEMGAGDRFSFSLLLFDRAVDLLPQVVYAVRLMGESGIGAGRRHNMGRFDLAEVRAGDRLIYSAADTVLHHHDSAGTIRLLPPDSGKIHRVRISLPVPLRLKQGNRLKRELPFHVLIRACLRRIAALEDAYGGGEPDLDYRGLAARAQQVRIQESNLRWQPLFRWSNRQRQKVSLAGLIGSLTFQGDLSEFLPILRYGEQVHVGKQTVFGLGRMRVDLPESSSMGADTAQ